MEYVLARQIDYQNYLLSREARRNERRRRRDLAKRDKVNAMEMGNGVQPVSSARQPTKDRGKEKRRSATSAPPPVLKPSKKMEGNKPKGERRRKERKSRSAHVPPAIVNMGPDPSGKVRHWILRQSDFMPKLDGEKK